jgi:[acyl-carrier-protein] S-malonyltransferase
MRKTAFVFPGQGSQSVGMGRELAQAFATARQVFEQVDEAIGQALSTLIFEGPEEQLTLTANTQPALMAVSVALCRTLEVDFGVRPTVADYVAGHSLGEYSALAAIGGISLADTARTLRVRGEAMQAACPVGQGAMAALIGKVDIEVAEAICRDAAADGCVVVANDNNVGNVVISGEKSAVEAAIRAGKVRGVRAVPLAVSAPFHSPLMAPAAEAVERALSGVAIGDLPVPLVSNVTARPSQSGSEIGRLLVAQVTGRVRWRESVAWMGADGGVGRFVEIGAGKQLSGMIRRICPDAEVLAVNGPDDLEAVASALRSL